jgi:glycerol transport system ATP-binding protein
MPCEVNHGNTIFSGSAVAVANSPVAVSDGKSLELGVRPEFVRFDDSGFDVEITRVDDLGRYQLVETRRDDHTIRMILSEEAPIPSENPRIAFDPAHTWVYADSWIVSEV